MKDNELLLDVIKGLTEEISGIKNTMEIHLNPDNYPSLANEVKKLNELVPELIKALNKR